MTALPWLPVSSSNKTEIHHKKHNQGHVNGCEGHVGKMDESRKDGSYSGTWEFVNERPEKVLRIGK